MAEWGPGPFENDDAADWVYDLEAGSIVVLRRALDIATLRYLEVREASIAIAAAEVIAAAVGRPNPALPDLAAQWVREHGKDVSDQLMLMAAAALDRVLGEYSELREVWSEAPEAGWDHNVQDLRQRLNPSHLIG